MKQFMACVTLLRHQFPTSNDKEYISPQLIIIKIHFLSAGTVSIRQNVTTVDVDSDV